MENHPMKLLFKGYPQLAGIIPYPVHADINFTLDGFIWPRVSECDDIGIIIMLQKVLVDLEQFLVGAKHII